MRIEQVSFRNFRAYRDQIDVVFPPAPSMDRSVYLIGGENGAGKTSFMMALGFALYGVDAVGVSYRPGRRDPADAYKAAVEDCFNRHARAAGDTSMAVAVRIEHDGDRFEIQREWWFDDGQMEAEDVRVRVNGGPVTTPDVDVTTFEGRTEVVAILTAALLPARAARFFFFDGEEVASLAERDLGKSVIAGLDDLLGLDAVGRLVAELARVEKRERDRLKSSQEKAEYEHAREAQLHAEQVLGSARTQLADGRAALEELEAGLREAIELLRLLFDGHTVEGAEQLRAELALYRSELEEVSRELSRSLGDSLASFVSHELTEVMATRVRRALHDREHRAVASAAEQQMKSVADRLMRRRLAPPLTAEQRAQLRSHLDALLTEMRPAEGEVVDVLGPLSIAELLRVDGRINDPSGDAFGSVREQARWRQQLHQHIRLTESHLRRFEQSSEAMDLLERRQRQTEAIDVQRGSVVALDGEAQAAETVAKEANEAVLLAEERLVGAELGAAKIGVARSARHVFDEFRSRLRDRRSTDLEKNVSSMLRVLLHRDGALDRVAIDVGTSSVTLFDGRGEEIPVPSAGEKEIFALALIHGLGQLSHRSAPLVIDTPLGRLDRAHREAIVSSFMPTASHQVIVLSTDSEIDDELYELLRPHLAWQATIRGSAGGAVVDEGQYFDRSTL